jgi:hypothetical protein
MAYGFSEKRFLFPSSSADLKAPRAALAVTFRCGRGGSAVSR